MRIPDAAMPVVEILRRDVPRPATMPVPRWDDYKIGPASRIWKRTRDGHPWRCDPMGLHPNSRDASPDTCDKWIDRVCECETPGQHCSVVEFATWWDSICGELEIREAINLIWPEASHD